VGWLVAEALDQGLDQREILGRVKSHAEVRKLVRLVLKHERVRSAAVNVVFVDDAKMTDLNGTYLKHWYATDVLSFTLGERAKGPLEGEVYVNLDQAARQVQPILQR